MIIALLIVIAIVIIKTVSFASKQIDVEALEKIEITDKPIQRLAGAVQIPTISTRAALPDSSAFLQLHEYLDKEFVFVDSILDKYAINEYSLVYKWPGKNARLKPICLMGHLDVVPVEDLSLDKWKEAPFSGKIKDGFIWGRGTMDDKVSVLGILEAVELLLKEGYQPERSIYLAFGHDEESSGINGAKEIAAHFEAEKIQFEYVMDEGTVILEEAMAGLNPPLAMIGISEKGYCTLTLNAQLEQGGHSSMPPQETAIGILSRALAKLEAKPFPPQLDGPASAMFEYVGPEMELPNKAIFANMWLLDGVLKSEMSKSPSSNAMMRTTTALTMLRAGLKENVLPSKATAKINFRIAPGDDVDFVVNYVRKIIDDPRIVVVPPEIIENPTPVSDVESFGFKVIHRTIKEIFPKTVVAPSLVIAATDSRFYTHVSDNIFRFVPLQIEREDLSRLHGINERINIEAYKESIRFYRQLILNSCR